MLRFTCRAIGLVLLALGFVGLVIDGTRSIANNAVRFQSLGDIGAAIFKERFLLLQPTIEQKVHPLLWDPVLRNVLLTPGSIAAFVLGAILLWLGRRPTEPIGFARRR